MGMPKIESKTYAGKSVQQAAQASRNDNDVERRTTPGFEENDEPIEEESIQTQCDLIDRTMSSGTRIVRCYNPDSSVEPEIELLQA